MKRPLVALVALICVAFAVAVIFPIATPVQAGNNHQPVLQVSDLNKAANYCVRRGGEVDLREPYFNTNDDQSNWFRLSGARQFCKFTSKEDGSQINVELSTLYTEEPTLAALAYYAEVPYDGSSCHGNPASCYCSQLGGSDLFGGINLNGGGWVQKSDVLEACIFPDMSTIDSWGLTYHQAAIIRGRDLSKVLRYKNPYGTK